MARAVSAWSPVSISTRMPASLRRRDRLHRLGRTGSSIPCSPASTSPSAERLLGERSRLAGAVGHGQHAQPLAGHPGGGGADGLPVQRRRSRRGAELPVAAARTASGAPFRYAGAPPGRVERRHEAALRLEGEDVQLRVCRRRCARVQPPLAAATCSAISVGSPAGRRAGPRRPPRWPAPRPAASSQSAGGRVVRPRAVAVQPDARPRRSSRRPDLVALARRPRRRAPSSRSWSASPSCRSR
jgi:hypothetical protein